jgi:GH35 family endo-1,4-beta-xylanase
MPIRGAIRPPPFNSFVRRCALEIILAAIGITSASFAAEPAVDEARVLAETDARIRQHRTAPLTIEVRDERGRGVAGAKVQVDHVRHRFFFGAGFDTQLLPRPNETEIDRRHREAFLQLFNYATVHLYWGSYEPRRGEYQDRARQQCVDWLKEHGLVARGHPIFWNHRAGVPGWVGALDPAPDVLRPLLDARLEQLSRTVLPGLRDVDVFNELTRWERFENPFTRFLAAEGKVPAVAHYLRETKRLNPNLLTVVNDYETSPDYARLLRELIETGAPVDIVGQQSHMHSGNWPVAKLWGVMERLAAFGRPVLFSEMSVLSGPRRQIDWKTESRIENWETDADNEAKQADYLEQIFRLVYSHPSTCGIVLWNYTDRRAWLGAPVGLLRKDGTRKPSFDRLDALINRTWRTRGEFTTDGSGRVTIPAAFEGSYRVTAAGQAQTREHATSAPLRMVFGATAGGRP